MKYALSIVLVSLLTLSESKNQEFQFHLIMAGFLVNNGDCKTTLLNKFYKLGEVQSYDKTYLIGNYQENSIDYKILLEKCNLVYYSIVCQNNQSRSMAKFDKNCLVFYDTINSDGNVCGMYRYGMIGYDSIQYIPNHLKEYVCDYDIYENK